MHPRTTEAVEHEREPYLSDSFEVPSGDDAAGGFCSHLAGIDYEDFGDTGDVSDHLLKKRWIP